MPPLDGALLAGLLTALVLFSAHYALDHLTPTFKLHPPRAYSVGVTLLGVGCGGWTLAYPGPWATWQVFGYYSLIVLVAGAGTWTAYTVHAWQAGHAASATDTVLEGD